MILGGKLTPHFGVEPALAFTSVTAGGAGDNTEIVGITIDRFYDEIRQFNDVTLAVKVDDLDLAADETLSLTVTIQDSADGITWNTAESVLPKTVVATGEAVNVMDAYKYGVNLTMYDRYIRLNVTPDMSAADTDTVGIDGLAILGNATQVPV